MKKIKLFLSKVRREYTQIFILTNLSRIFILAPSLFIILSVFEEIFYFDSYTRKFSFIFFITLIATLLLYNFMYWLLENFLMEHEISNEKYAQIIGDHFPSIKDRLLNILQINRDYKSYSLTRLATENIVKDLKKIDVSNFIKSHLKYNKISSRIFLGSILIIIIQLFLINPAIRIIKFNDEFEPPLPFQIIPITQDLNIHYNDSTSVIFNIENIINTESKEVPLLKRLSSLISFNQEDYIPDSIILNWKNHEGHFVKKIGSTNGIFSYHFNNIKSNTNYWISYESKSYFSSWDTIGTKPYKISIIETPRIEDIEFKIVPPSYTKLEPIIMSGYLSSTIELLFGSKVQTNIIANKSLKKASIILNDIDSINLILNEKNAYGEFYFEKDTTLKIFCQDFDNVFNINPIEYSFNKINDTPPNIIVNAPEYEFILDESYNIDLNFNVNDDYGFSELRIEYYISSSEAPLNEKNYNIYKVDLNSHISENTKNINIYSPWDISSLPISMGDNIHFWIYAQDNNNFKESISKSKIFIGSFPTLEDLFTEIEEYEEDSDNILEDISDTISEILEETSTTIQDTKKYNDLSFEDKKEIEESIEKIDEIYKEIETIQENIEKILEQAENNNIFDNDLIEKFEYFHEMLNSIMTDELKEAMENLENNMDNMDPTNLVQALENFELNVEQLEQELDRFIDMFELAQAEQKLNELTEYLENLVDKQTDLVNELSSDEVKPNLLSAKSKKQEERVEKLPALIEESAKTIESMSPEIAEQLNNINNNSTIPDIQNNLNNTSQKIDNNDNSGANENANSAKEDIESLNNQIKQIKADFRSQNMKDILSSFISILDNLIIISNQQETLITTCKDIRSNSPLLRDINSKQNDISIGINHILEKLLLLSNKTFFITPDINRSFGRIKLELNKVIGDFAQKKIGTAKSAQINVLSEINLTIYLLLEALNELQASENLSGFEQFLESLEAMSEEQKGINQQTMQLSQFGPSQQQSILNELLKRQQELKQQLEELLGENPGSTPGGMEELLEELEEIIKDFENNNITRETIERQEKIVSKLLDYQKSLEKKDFTNKRESNTATESIYNGPDGLPEDLGNKNLLLINAMESALDEGFSNEYNKRIRNYFLNLQKSK